MVCNKHIKKHCQEFLHRDVYRLFKKSFLDLSKEKGRNLSFSSSVHLVHCQVALEIFFVGVEHG